MAQAGCSASTLSFSLLALRHAPRLARQRVTGAANCTPFAKPSVCFVRRSAWTLREPVTYRTLIEGPSTQRKRLICSGTAVGASNAPKTIHGDEGDGEGRKRLLDVSATPATVPILRELYEESLQNGENTENVAGLISACFPFELDAFQLQALAGLARGDNVILSAPTGSGKTVVGEIAIHLALARRMRVFYTTPLKALSNQKFFDFKKLFGEDRVGLLTGDVAVNRDAPIVVMTTEVYRNMLYADGNADAILVTDDVFAVVFDEFHYLNDADRGTVWEESVVNSPSHVLLVALSATMANTEDVRDWFTDVQGPTVLVESNFRPVPLTFSYCQREGIVPLFASEKIGNRKARRKAKKADDTKSSGPKMHPKLLASLVDQNERGRRRDRDGRPGRRRARSDEDEFALLLENHDAKSNDDRRRGGSRDRRSGVPSYPYVVRGLRRRDMLPGIVFIFSRNGCDTAARATAAERESLVTPEERAEIERRLDEFSKAHPDLVQPERLELALQGICSHHAGLLPLWKTCVEEMFQDGLIKIVFATETLAAGINMPARSTVISALSKRAGEMGIVQLSTSEVLQMAGRAGRRGKDTVGYSVVMQSPFEGPIDAFKKITADVDVLRSHFTPSYGMVLNLLQTRSLEDARSLVERSFGSFLSRKHMKRLQELKKSGGGGGVTSGDVTEDELKAMKYVIDEAKAAVSKVDEEQLKSYFKAVERVKAERRALGYLLRQSREQDTQLVEDTLAFAPPGTRVELRGSRSSGKSRGSVRRRRRREISAACEDAAKGDGGQSLRACFLDPIEDEEDPLDDQLDDPHAGREILHGVLLDVGPQVGANVLFAAVCHDGTVCYFDYEHVHQLYFESDVVDVDEVAPTWRDVEAPPRSEWHSIQGNQFTVAAPPELEPLVQIARGRADATQNDADAADGRDTPPNEASERPDIHAQRERLGHAKKLAADIGMSASEEGRAAIRAHRAIPQLQALYTERKNGGGKSQAALAKQKSGRELRRSEEEGAKRAAAIRESAMLSSQDADIFGYFMKLVSVLQHYGFIDDECGVTAIGEVGAKVRAENELWASLALMDPSLEHASPVHLGAIVGAILSEGTRQDVYVAFRPSPEVIEHLRSLEPLRTRLVAVQGEYNVDMPVWLDGELMGLVEAWASGAEWVELLANTSLQEGDICRVIRRVLDLLRQVPHLPFVSEGVKLNAKRAVALLDRFPVVDYKTYAVRDSEKLYDDAARDSEKLYNDVARE